ncbi:MAG: hypothetical protein E7652_03320 [Ruminococcaceae bacterium]|nr:hypothetical protein [Oscillospiraceae bacterium]
MTCTFFGHRDANESIAPLLKKEIIKLIEYNGVTTFYIGNHGRFDTMAESILHKLKVIYPHITYYIAGIGLQRILEYEVNYNRFCSTRNKPSDKLQFAGPTRGGESGMKLSITVSAVPEISQAINYSLSSSLPERYVLNNAKSTVKKPSLAREGGIVR